MGPEAPAPVLHVALDPSTTRPVKRSESAAPTTPPAGDPPREPAPALLLSGDLVVEVDAAAGRFVQKLFDHNTDDVLRQWPSERQLAFARAVKAYLASLKI